MIIRNIDMVASLNLHQADVPQPGTICSYYYYSVYEPRRRKVSPWPLPREASKRGPGKFFGPRQNDCVSEASCRLSRLSYLAARDAP